MHHASIRRIFPAFALCAVLSGCAGLAPGWGSPAGASSRQSVPLNTSTAVVMPVAGMSLEDGCHAEAWQHRLDVPGDQGLAYGQAYRRCVARLSGAGPAPDAAGMPVDAAPAAPQRRVVPRAARG